MKTDIKTYEYDEDGDIKKTNIITGIELELNKTYVQCEGEYCEIHYKIIFIDDKIAVGLSVYEKIGYSKGNYQLFNKNNGLAYNNQLCYRLTKEII